MPKVELLDIITTALEFAVVPPEVGVDRAPFDVDFDDPHAATVMIAAGTSNSLILRGNLDDRRIREDVAMHISLPPPT